MSYHLPNRRVELSPAAATSKTFAPEGDLPANLEADDSPAARDTARMAKRWSVAGARFHARFAETARKSFR